MDDYFEISRFFAVPTIIIVWLACGGYAVEQYGWFIGIPLGFLIGFFFSVIAAIIVTFLWPLIILAIILAIAA